MGNFRDSSILVLGLGAITACSSKTTAKPDAPIVLIDAAPDAPKPIDAPADAPPAPADTSCITTAIPTTTSAATITLSGTARSISTSGAGNVTGAIVTAKDAADNNLVSTSPNPETLAMDGNFTFTFAPGGNAIDGHATATLAGQREAILYPPHPLVADQTGAPILLLSDSTWNTLGSLGGAPSETGNKGGMFMFLLDCAQNPVEGATIKVQQGGSDVAGAVISYARPFMTFPAPSSAASTDKSGVVYVFDVAATAAGKETTIIATVGGVSFRPHVVKVFTGSDTETAVQP